MTESLLYIASHDDLVRIVGTDEKLAERVKVVYPDRETTFDPILSAASNPELLDTIDVYTKYTSSLRSYSKSKRKFGRFDKVKWIKYFIEARSKFLDDENSEEIKRTGFDSFAYLMKYETEIKEFYSGEYYSDLSDLQKAALHFIEIGKDLVDVDYLKYLATYDDLALGAVSSLEVKPSDVETEDWLKTIAKDHYTSKGQAEIESGARPIIPFFDPIMYVATHAAAKDVLLTAEGIVDEVKAAISCITFGIPQGLLKNAFAPFVYLSNYPELLKDDILENGKINPRKVAQIWLTNWTPDLTLNKFDAGTFSLSKGLEEGTDAFETFVKEKVTELAKNTAKSSSIFKIPKFLLPKFSCASAPKILEPEAEPEKEPEPEPEKEPEPEPEKEPEPAPKPKPKRRRPPPRKR